MTLNTEQQAVITAATDHGVGADLYNMIYSEGPLTDGLYETLYNHFMSDMPYGTAKARDGDPHEWIADKIERLWVN